MQFTPFFVLLLAGSGLAAAFNGTSTVVTTSGPVSGHAASNISSVTAFLGIPYAKPPTGSLRFQPPQKYNGTVPISGQNFGLSCPQGSGAPAGTGPTGIPNFAAAGITPAGVVLLTTVGSNTEPIGEDCLSLNLWVPSGGAKTKPVMIFIHGGGLTTGSSNIPIYDGEIFANEQDVIVVTINYRLGVFGFPGNPSTSQKNFGLLDQRLAVEWVRDNIAAFGGDTKRMVLQGQSAGSASIDLYSFAYAEDPIVSGFIMESGVMTLAVGGGGAQLPGGPPPSSPASNSSEGWFNASSALGCGGSTSNPATVLTCMQNQTMDAILAATTTIGFQPTADNVSVFSDYSALTAAGKFSKLPILIGSNDHETGMFEALSGLAATNASDTLPPEAWIAIDNTVFVCPVSARANSSAQHGVTTYRYRYFGSFPNTAISATSGAWHTSELLQIFGIVPPASATVPASTTAEVAFMKYMRGAWAAFVKDPEKGLTTYGWPVYDPAAKTLVQLAINNMTGPNLATVGKFDAVCVDIVTAAGNSSAVGGTNNSSANAPQMFLSIAPARESWSWVLSCAVSILVSVQFMAWL